MLTLYTLTSGLHSEAAGKPSEERFILAQWGAVHSTAWFAIAFVIFFSTFFSYFLVPFGQKYLQPTTVAMYNYLQPVTASLIAVAASQETFGPVKALAMLLVFLGVWFVSTSEQRKPALPFSRYEKTATKTLPQARRTIFSKTCSEQFLRRKVAAYIHKVAQDAGLEERSSLNSIMSSIENRMPLISEFQLW